MLHSNSLRIMGTRILIGLIAAASLAGLTASPVSAQMTDADVYEHVVKPQEEKRAADIAEILARPSNWGPGEIRDNSSFGGIAWYDKGNGDYGYIVTRGYISTTSASVQMMIECNKLKVECQGSRPLANQWLAVGKRTDKIHYVTSGGDTRETAEARVLAMCREEGGTCVIQSVHNIMPHKRGITYLRPKVDRR